MLLSLFHRGDISVLTYSSAITILRKLQMPNKVNNLLATGLIVTVKPHFMTN